MDLEEIKQNRLEEFQEKQKQEAELEEKIKQLEMIAKQIFTKKALERYGNLKAAHPDKAVQLLVVIGQAIQSGNIKQIDDDKLKDILIKLTPEKKEFKIKRR